MIYLKLFLTFLEIGAFSFGGGYGMISIIRERVIANGWMEEDQLMNMIAVSESTPGPLAVNMATFIGSTKAGIPGALLATFGVVLPSFAIILIIAALISNFLKYKGVAAFLAGVRPCIVGLIIATGMIMFLNRMLVIGGEEYHTFSVDCKGMAIFALLVLLSVVVKKLTGKAVSPILMIAVSAGLGIVAYGLI